MKATFTCLLLALTPLTSSIAQTVDLPATHVTKDNPVVDVNDRYIAILMADGSERMVRYIMRSTSVEIRVMTDDGVTGIPFEKLHPATQAFWGPRIKATEEDEAKKAAEDKYWRDRREKADADHRRQYAEKQAAEDAIKAQQQAAAAKARAQQQAAYLQHLQIVEAEERATAAYLANQQAARAAIAAKQAADPRAVAQAKREERARAQYQLQLQERELEIFNSLLEVQQLELLRRLGYLQ
jgi:hypothetical protein